MKIEVLLSNSFIDQAPLIDITNQICLVIDVLRATSTITAALGSGAEKVIVSPSNENAFKIKNSFPNTILCGEEKGIKIKGFDFDNSPLQLSRLDLTNKNVILKTSNGTESIIKTQRAKETLSLSILNLHYTLDYATEVSKKNQSDLFFLCSGKWGEVSYDDVFAAGLGIKYLIEQHDHLELSDTAILVLNAASSEKYIYDALTKSQSGRYALSLGLKEDIIFCSQLNRFNITGKLELDNRYEGLSPLFVIKPC